MRFAILFVAVAAFAAGSAPGRLAAQAAPAAKAVRPPLEGLATRPTLVLPTQYALFSDTLKWAGSAPKGPVLLAALDSLIGEALRERGLSSWTFADGVTRAAKRNAGFVADPHALAAFPLKSGRRPPDGQLAEPLASQLRSLIALNDARQVILPVEFRVVNQDGKARAVLRLVVIDARRSQAIWIGEVAAAPASVWSGSVLAELATQVANLVVAP